MQMGVRGAKSGAEGGAKNAEKHLTNPKKVI